MAGAATTSSWAARCVARPSMARLRPSAWATAAAAKTSGMSARGACCPADRKSTRLNSSHSQISYAVFCLKKKKKQKSSLDEHDTERQRDRLHRQVVSRLVAP